eukprot:gi/632968673/ref/XP_007900653.1/ PREDICTED: TSC22 domain family protein 2 isoform X2 [Callorhinchus milii]
MPVKKKSGFQITSVTTAQVAASSLTEDTESLEDPDESRTEDLSSDIFDVSSRATDYEQEEVCDRSSSEETLNNVGEADTPGAVSPNLPQDGLPGPGPPGPGPPGPGPTPCGLSSRLTAGPATPAPGAAGGAGPAATPPLSSSSSGTASVQPAVACTSRFRVIKLDHGSGEPFRRGRWTCTEFYDRDSDSTVLGRTCDSIRHNSSALEQQSAERDSGLGATASSGLGLPSHSVPAAESLSDGSQVVAVSQVYPTSAVVNPSLGGPQQHQSLVNVQTAAGQPNGMALQPPNATISQTNVAGAPLQAPPPQFTFAQTQLPPVHLLPSQAAVPNSQLEYMQLMQGPGAIPQSANSLIPSAGGPSLTVVPGPSPVMQASGALVMGVPAQSSDSVGLSGQGMQNVVPGTVPGVVLQHQSLGSSGVQQHVQASSLQPGMVSQLSGLFSGSHIVAPGIQNVPAVVPSTGVSSVPTSMPTSISTTPVTMPNVPATMVQLQQSTQTSIIGSTTGLMQSGLPAAMQGSINLSSTMSQTNLSQFPAQQGAGQLEERRSSEQLIPQSGESKPSMKPFIPEILGNPLHLQVATPMNSLANSVFSIPIDGDEDSASGASVVAIDNKIEQAMDLVKSHLMYAVREEVEVLKEQIKELIERNCSLERENSLLKSLTNNDQLSQLQIQPSNPSSTSQPQQPTAVAQAPASTQQTQPPPQPNVSSA